MVRTVIVIVGLSALVRAEPSQDVMNQAKAHFELGRQAYEAGDFDKALREFKAAQTLAPSPMLDFNIGIAYERMNNPPLAVEHYRRYLDAKPDATNRADVEKRIAALAPGPTPPAPPPTVTPPPPQATTCPEGQSVTEDTDGRCCWPGQVWSKRRQVCAGIPTCPAGYSVSGEACGKGQIAPPTAPRPQAVTPPPMPMWQPYYQPWQQAPPGTSMVNFSSKRPNYNYTVTVGKQACITPCALFLKPGAHAVAVTGAATFKARIEVPQGPAMVRVEHLRVGRIVTGAIFTTLGVSGLLTGIGMLTAVGLGELRYWGAIPLLLGCVFTPIGIPLLATIDGDRVRVLGAREASTRPRLIAIGASPTGDGASFGAAFSF